MSDNFNGIFMFLILYFDNLPLRTARWGKTPKNSSEVILQLMSYNLGGGGKYQG